MTTIEVSQFPPKTRFVVDTNIIIDYLCKRNPTTKLLDNLSQGGHILGITSSIVSLLNFEY